MNYTDFFDRLVNISDSYHWSVENNRVVAKIRSGPNRGQTLNPITALAHKSGFGFFSNNKADTEYAGSLLGLTRHCTRSLYSAIVGTKNRGNTQVIRGRIRSALEV
jgi:hypothetical protein